MSVTTRVVNIRKEQGQVYIGRQKTMFHWGNPFASVDSKIASLKVDNRNDSILAFYDWLKGDRHQAVEPERRAWILENLETLRGKSLGCFCHPKACHGDAYRVVLGELALDDLLQALTPQEKTTQAPVREEDQMALF